MVRAATSGMIEFSNFDPWDVWWWRKLDWTLTELANQMDREVVTARHNHWVTMSSHGRLTQESFDEAKASAGKAFNRLLALTYPWDADKIGEEGTKTARDEAVSQYHEIFGRPGEERYEKMVDELYAAMKQGKQTARQKDKSRKLRKLRRQQAREKLLRSQS